MFCRRAPSCCQRVPPHLLHQRPEDPTAHTVGGGGGARSGRGRRQNAALQRSNGFLFRARGQDLIFNYCWTGIHFSYNFLIFYHLYLLREFTKKYEVLLIFVFLLFGGFLVSEALLFVSFFWTSFHLLSCPTLGMWPGEAFYLPDPCELTFANTLLLFNAAISLGNAFINLEISSQYITYFLHFVVILFIFSFISLQIKEFRILAYSISDSLTHTHTHTLAWHELMQ